MSQIENHETSGTHTRHSKSLVYGYMHLEFSGAELRQRQQSSGYFERDVRSV